MSRSTGSHPQTGGRPQQRTAGQQPSTQHYPQAAYPAPVDVPAIDPYAQHQGYHYPQGHHDNAYAASSQQAASGQSQAGYAPQFDPYAPQSAQSQYRAAQQGYQSQQAYTQQPSPDMRGTAYDQWANQVPAADPRGYDLSSYSGPNGQQGYDQQNGAYGAVQADWGQHAVDPSLDPNGYAAGQGGSLEPAYAEDDAGYELEDQPRGRGLVKIAAVLVTAIVAGGGLMYAYNTLLGSSGEGAPPLVKSASGPSKIKPAEPGGKQFAHTDSKIMGRLGDGSESEADTSGTKKVSTLVVGRDGSIQPPAETAETAAPAALPATSLPGMSIVDIGGPAAAAAAAPAPEAKPASVSTETTTAAERPVVVTPPAAGEKPVVTAKAAPTAAPPAPSVVAAAADETPTAAPPAKKAVVAAAKPTPAPSAAASAPKPTGAGYVAVLASVPASANSRINALQQFADLQQKYGTALQNKTPDVQEANLGEKGTYHRLVVGPPGSRESANAVCSQLKAAGYNGCWVMAY